MPEKNLSIKKYLSKFWDARFILSNAFVPLLVLSLYLILFAFLLPSGVNKVFASKSWMYSLTLAGAAGLVSLALLRSNKRTTRFTMNRVEKLTAPDLILLLLPMMPIAQYVIINQEILAPAQMVYIAVIFLGVSFLFIAFIPILLSRVAATRTLMLLGTAFAFTITNMARLSNQFSWFEQGSLRFQWAILGGIFVISWFLYDLNYKSLLHVLVAVLFITNSALQIYSVQNNKDNPLIPTPGDSTQDPAINNKLAQLVEGRTPISTPNIYLLIYDAYVINETMLSYGIDNGKQEAYLTNAGFTIYPHTYSVGSFSIATMSRVFNASTDYYGESMRAVSGDGVVQNLLKSFGYRTYGIFQNNYFFRGMESSYDVTLPSEEAAMVSLVTEAVLTGEFRFDLQLDFFRNEDFEATKHKSLAAHPLSPVLLFTHTNVPSHAQTSGQCLPNETQLFEERLQQANLRMQRDVELLLENHAEAIIIIAGDHGPYLTKNCYVTSKGNYDISEITRQDIQDRYGSFLAIRWPTPNFDLFDDIVVLQDVFPSVFAYLFNDPSLLDARIDPVTLGPERVSGALVRNGIIVGGANDGEPLFLNE